MASKSKRKKGINSYIWHFGLKSKGKGAKRVDFYSADADNRAEDNGVDGKE